MANIEDYKIFPNDTFASSKVPHVFARNQDPKLGQYITIKPKVKNQKLDKCQTLDNYIKNSFPLGMMIIKNDTILYEKYDKGFNETSLLPSFSMIKSIGIFPLVGIAIKEGKINSLDDPIKLYLKNLNPKLDTSITIRHLLNMTSGIKESKMPFSPTSSGVIHYYTQNLNKQIPKIKSKRPPGELFMYSATSSTLLLGEILEHTYQAPLGQLFNDKIWSKLGMQAEGLWSKDHKNGRVKPFCCFNTTMSNYARLARLFANNGNWNGEQVFPKDWLSELQKPENNTSDVNPKINDPNSRHYYAMHWFVNKQKPQVYKAAGFLSQHIIFFPDENAYIITFSKLNGMRYNKNFCDIYFDIVSQLP